jgi:RNA polymerase sigma-70 factor (ECF subfamily)
MSGSIIHSFAEYCYDCVKFLQYQTGNSVLLHSMSDDSQQSESDRQRFESWVTDHGSAVRGYLLGMVRKADQADDLLQETFRRAWQSRGRYQETGFARAYLIRIADRLVIDIRRKSGRETTYDDDYWQLNEPADEQAAPAATIELHEIKQQLAAAIDTLSPPQRRVLLLRFYGEMEFKQIAQLLDCPLSTALSHCRRGLLSLRKQMEAEDL